MSLLQLSYRLLNSNNAGDNLVHDDGEAVDVSLLRATRQSRPVRSQQFRRSPQQRCVEQQPTPCVCVGPRTSGCIVLRWPRNNGLVYCHFGFSH